MLILSRKLLAIFLLTFLFVSLAYPAECKNAVIVTAFGSSKPEAVQSLSSFVEVLSKERTDLTFYTAFSSYEILEKTNDDSKVQSLPSAVSHLAAEGYKNIAILPLHIAPGESYQALRKSANDLGQAFRGTIEITVASPLVANEQDAFSLASYLIYSLPAEVKPGEVVVFVGNGSNNEGSLIYPALNWALFLQGEKGSLYLVVNLEDRDSISEAIKIITLNRRKVVWMLPLMSLNGVKADEKIFSTDDHSVASRFKDAGLTVRPYKQGLVSNPTVQAMWRAKLNRIFPPVQSAENVKK